MSWTPGGRDLCRWPAPWPKPDVIPGVQQVHTPAYRPDAAFYNQGYVGRGLGGHLCLPAIAATTAQGGQHSCAKITNNALRIARCKSRNFSRASWPSSPGPESLTLDFTLQFRASRASTAAINVYRFQRPRALLPWALEN